MTNETTFNAALPYGAGVVAIGVLGAVTAVTASGVALQVAGIAAGVFGAYALGGVIMCGMQNAGDPKKFREEVGQYIIAAAGSAIAQIAADVAKQVLTELVSSRFQRNTYGG